MSIKFLVLEGGGGWVLFWGGWSCDFQVVVAILLCNLSTTLKTVTSLNKEAGLLKFHFS